jgi:hypothetical protein
MPTNRLYHTWIQQILELRPGQRITQIRNFVWLLIGIYESRSVSLSRIASKIPGPAQLLSLTRRLSRLLENPAIDVRSWYEPIARRWLEQQAHYLQQVMLIVDGTKVGFTHQLLIVSLAYRRRAIPIAWTWVQHVRGHSTADAQLALLSYVRSLIPQGIAVLLVGDTEFGPVELLHGLDKWRWDYVLRQKTSTHVCLADQTEWRDFGSWVEKAGRSVWLGKGWLTESEIYPLNLLAHWKTGEKGPWCLATNLPDKQMTLRAYARRMWIEIVFTQMTKMDVFARRTGRDHVSDLDITIPNNHTVNKQFYQFPFLFKVSILQPDLDTDAEILDRSCQASELVLPAHLMKKLFFQVFHALTLTVQVGSSALVLGQRDDTIQVSFGESVQLGLKSDLSAAQIFTTSLQLLWEPVTPLRSLQSCCDAFRMRQNLTQIVPDQFIQLVSWNISSRTAFMKMGVNHIRLSPTHIVCVAGLQLASCATEVANTAAHQGSQQVRVGSVIAAGNLLVVGQFGLDQFKLLQFNDDWNVCNGDPFFRRDWGMAPVWPTNWMGSGTAQARFDHTGAPNINSAGIRGISQDTSRGGCVPVFTSLWRKDTHSIQMLDQSVEGSVFLQIKCEHLTHDRRFRFVDRDFGGISRVIWIDLIPINRLGPGQQNPSPVFSLTPATHPVGNQDAFILCNRASDLQNQLVMRVLADRAIQEFDLTTIFFPFFQQQHLVNIVPRQTIRCRYHNTVDLSGSDSVSQVIQTRPVEACATVAIISKDVLLRQIPSLLADIGHQPFQLLFDCLGLDLALGRDPGINCYLHVAPPGPSVSDSLRQSEQSLISVDRLDPIGSVRLDTLAHRDGSSTGVSWLPPHSDSSDTEYIFCSVVEERNRSGRRQWLSRN